ncbi:MAG TPA: dihydrodipicolinate reductase [Acidobacteriota bacterium]|nr:dihydrodipicolinate reductase [Acidobacteriota bacterium]
MRKRIKVIQCGLGPIGLRLTHLLAQRPWIEIVGAVDINPEKEGESLDALAELRQPLDVKVVSGFEDLQGVAAHVVILTTSSQLQQTGPLILECVARGWEVVSTCEELAFPWETHPELSSRIDSEARRQGVSVLGTGINPGFLMDYLPAAATGLCQRVDSIRVERIQDAVFRRLPFQRKIGAGLPPREFTRRVEEGSLRHVGLTESMHLMAACLGWTLERTEDEVEPVIAEREVELEDHTIQPGQALGVKQTGRGWRDGLEVMTLVFQAAVGQENPRDRIHIMGSPPLEIVIPGGVNGDIGTCAITANAAHTILRAPAGLRTMADIPLVSCRN